MDETTQITRELIISSDVSEVNIVLLEDKQLVEFHKEQKNNNIAVGDVYLGRVKKILPGLNSAFIDIGSRKDAFYITLTSDLRFYHSKNSPNSLKMAIQLSSTWNLLSWKRT
jgi:Ribonuclease G/E